MDVFLPLLSVMAAVADHCGLVEVVVVALQASG
jgi:hypothetical protein